MFDKYHFYKLKDECLHLVKNCTMFQLVGCFSENKIVEIIVTTKNPDGTDTTKFYKRKIYYNCIDGLYINYKRTKLFYNDFDIM